jgi:hypothetical protein
MGGGVPSSFLCVTVCMVVRVLGAYLHARPCSKPEYQATLALLETVVGRMPALSSSDLVLTLHRSPENNYSPAQALSDFGVSLAWLSKTAAESNVTVHLKCVLHDRCWPFAAVLDCISTASNTEIPCGVY